MYINVEFSVLYVHAQSLSHVQICVTPWTVAHQAPRSMGFSWHEYWGGLPCPPLGDLPHPRIEPMSLIAPALAGMFFTVEPLGSPQYCTNNPLKIIEISIIVRINIGFEFYHRNK